MSGVLGLSRLQSSARAMVLAGQSFEEVVQQTLIPPADLFAALNMRICDDLELFRSLIKVYHAAGEWSDEERKFMRENAPSISDDEICDFLLRKRAR